MIKQEAMLNSKLISSVLVCICVRVCVYVCVRLCAFIWPRVSVYRFDDKACQV